MKFYFNRRIRDAIRKHAVAESPDEAAGMIVAGVYIPCENISEIKTETFKIDSAMQIRARAAGLEAIVHSHVEYPHLSKRDMQQQIKTAVPWGVVNVSNGIAGPVWFWGDQIRPQDLIERPFFHGLHDCYTIVRDFYRESMGVKLAVIPREFGWWRRGQNLIENGLKSGWRAVKKGEVEFGDVLLFKLGTKIVNHLAIYDGGGKIIHHAAGRLSCCEAAGPWIKHAYKIVRRQKKTK